MYISDSKKLLRIVFVAVVTHVYNTRVELAADSCIAAQGLFALGNESALRAGYLPSL